MRAILTTVIAVSWKKHETLGNPVILEGDRGFDAAEIAKAGEFLLRHYTDAVKVEVWRHGQKVDEQWLESVR